MTKSADEFNENAEVIQALVLDLYKADPGDDRFRIYDAIAYHAEQLFAGGVGAELKSGHMSKETKIELLANPAAAVLLAYFVDSLVRFNSMNGAYLEDSGATVNMAQADDAPNRAGGTAVVKRETLAKSLHLVGRKGEAYAPISVRLDREMWFRRALNAALRTELAIPGATRPDAEHAARSSALRHVFKLVHHEDYLYDDDTHKSRMKQLRAALAHVQFAEGSGDL